MGKTWKEMDRKKAKKYKRIRIKQHEVFDRKHEYINSKLLEEKRR